MAYDFGEFKDFVKQLENLSNSIEIEIQDFFYEMALKCLAKTKKRTPVDTGDLRNHWELSSMVINKDRLHIYIYNNLEYASWIEYGHRLVRHFVPGEWKGNRFIYNPNSKTGTMMGVKTNWIEGKFMCSISMKEIQDIFPSEWDKRLKRLLGGLK